MTTTKDPLLRMALKLQTCLESRLVVPSAADVRFLNAIDDVLTFAHLLEDQRKTFRLAARHQWQGTVTRTIREMPPRLQHLRESTQDAIQLIPDGRTVIKPTLRDLHLELKHLGEEFSEVQIDLKCGLISVETDSIELADMTLGPFRIELSLTALSRRCDSSVFSVEALDPHPASSNGSVIHPHVQDGKVCCGDGAFPIACALREGRLVDAFLTLNSVLHTYNASSAYVSLDDWEGTPCSDCGNLVDNERRNTCDWCDDVFCDGCSSYCQSCDSTFCASCLKETENGDQCCPRCRENCTECGRLFPSSALEEGLCPDCVEQPQPEKTDEHDPSPTTGVITSAPV